MELWNEVELGEKVRAAAAAAPAFIFLSFQTRSLWLLRASVCLSVCLGKLSALSSTLYRVGLASYLSLLSPLALAGYILSVVLETGSNAYKMEESYFYQRTYRTKGAERTQAHASRDEGTLQHHRGPVGTPRNLEYSRKGKRGGRGAVCRSSKEKKKKKQ